MYHYEIFLYETKKKCAREKKRSTRDRESNALQLQNVTEKKNAPKHGKMAIVYTSLYSTCKSTKYIACNDIFFYFHFGSILMHSTPHFMSHFILFWLYCFGINWTTISLLSFSSSFSLFASLCDGSKRDGMAHIYTVQVK